MGDNTDVKQQTIRKLSDKFVANKTNATNCWTCVDRVALVDRGTCQELNGVGDRRPPSPQEWMQARR